MKIFVELSLMVKYIQGDVWMKEISLKDDDFKTLSNLGIDVINQYRKYWFIRTQGGKYYQDFINENYVGIEWDEISDVELINRADRDEMKVEVTKNYPEADKPGYIVSQILNFAIEIRKGDIVLIPSENSSWIAFGEVLQDDMYIYEDDDFQDLLDDFYDDANSKSSIVKKRRKVKWIKEVKRSNLDPYLYGIIYAHSAIFNLDKYDLYIDRTLSQFYIKGKEAFFTYKVNKKKNIPYFDILKLLNDNYEIINFINRKSESLHIDGEQLILKINVQSKGPIQLKGSIKNVLILGLVIGLLCGVKFDFKVPGFEYKVETQGLPALISSVNDVISKNREDEDMKKITKELKDDNEKLDLKIPSYNKNSLPKEDYKNETDNMNEEKSANNKGSN
ncbi:hypothetical protein [Clostridium tyrobutyricum]|uniref:hypothetical protein n=1 Tax=Clostridium tyrobutyricum TaxID=1519 RepID=UPI002B1F3141|nr:hypothetical protein [Clostridium tyrobutyricum]MEA5008203.1 hypothetical protein [Clostridium tyrobutyricum]